MESSKKEGYIAGGIFILVAILLLLTGFDNEWEGGS